MQTSNTKKKRKKRNQTNEKMFQNKIDNIARYNKFHTQKPKTKTQTPIFFKFFKLSYYIFQIE